MKTFGKLTTGALIAAAALLPAAGAADAAPAARTASISCSNASATVLQWSFTQISGTASITCNVTGDTRWCVNARLLQSGRTVATGSRCRNGDGRLTATTPIITRQAAMTAYRMAPVTATVAP